MGRRRSKCYQDFPPNLLYDKSTKVYRYRRPDTGKYTYMGKNKSKAVSAAKQLNSLIMPGQDLVAKVMGTSITLEQFIQEYFLKHHLPERKLSKMTLSNYKNQIKIINKNLGHKQVNNITVKDIANFLKIYGFKSEYYPVFQNLQFAGGTSFQTILKKTFEQIAFERADEETKNFINKYLSNKDIDFKEGSQ